ncbi:glucosamine-6-phosphate deaminase [Anaeromicropila populeti]|uniref:Glucosamine-6-phosphate deaminase n=1 Tax=Anaeromicropila populeti TaxID=37658 RepID=A0A1I6IFR0_9FIRM|nr:glucosamine-6-phosphate deaminase [Anaeromicropila populeti]SFR65627.1 glucosamine-6-phosphate deaminase [Anaeromicropila populeti]
MQVYKAKDYRDMSRKAANLISAQVILKPDCVLGLATGSTPIGTYQQMIEWYQKGDIDFSRVKTVNLDEYKGISNENPQSYHYFMKTQFFQHINIREDQSYLPEGMAEEEKAECERYDNVISRLGGIDLQLLGLGHNGHIGFNEPGDAFQLGTHCVALSDSTIKANSRLFAKGEKVPEQAYTVGMKTIMQAGKILCIVSGSDKAEIVKKAFFGPVTPAVPASILQLHPDFILIGDEEALSMCQL